MEFNSCQQGSQFHQHFTNSFFKIEISATILKQIWHLLSKNQFRIWNKIFLHRTNHACHKKTYKDAAANCWWKWHVHIAGLSSCSLETGLSEVGSCAKVTWNKLRLTERPIFSSSLVSLSNHFQWGWGLSFRHLFCPHIKICHKKIH